MTANQRREIVLQAALIEFAARGLHGTPTHDIAQRAGISQPYLFRLFPTKKTLFLALVRRCFQQVTQVLATAAAGQTGADARQAMESAFGQLCKARTLPLMQMHAYAASTDPEIRAATRAGFRELKNSVEQLTGLPPAQVQRWLGIAVLNTAATAMNLQAWFEGLQLTSDAGQATTAGPVPRPDRPAWPARQDPRSWPAPFTRCVAPTAMTGDTSDP